MNKVRAIGGSLKKIHKPTQNSKIRNKTIKPFEQSSQKLQQLSTDTFQLNSNDQEIYNNYKNLEEVNTLTSFERRDLAKMEDEIAHGYFRDEEMFDETSEYITSGYGLDDVVNAENPKRISIIPNVYFPDTNLDKLVQRKLKRIDVGNKLVRYANKMGRSLKMVDTPYIAEEAIIQKEAGLSKEQILTNFERAFLHDKNPSKQEFSVELFKFLGKYPEKRHQVVLLNHHGNEVVNSLRIELLNENNA